MKLVRIGVILFILLSGFFVTCYGGMIPYRLFQFALLVPVTCLLYTLYVYIQFKIYQEVEHKTLTKNETADYLIQIGNEDAITYEHIKLNFFEENSQVLDMEPFRECYLTPGEKKEYKTSVLCRYRGTYAIGVKSVQITDFLHLFSIQYPIKESYKATVYPKTVLLEKCFFLEEDYDEKHGIALFQDKRQEPDSEIRPYMPGDEKRLIAWKAYAKYQELFTRKWINGVKQEVSLYMEMLPPEENRIAIEDKILECALAISNYCVCNYTACQIIFEQSGVRVHQMRDALDYHAFYQETAELSFRGSLPAERLVEEVVPQSNQILVFLVLAVTDALLESVSAFTARNQRVILLVQGKEPEGWDGTRADALILFLMQEDDVKKVLEEGKAV